MTARTLVVAIAAAVSACTTQSAPPAAPVTDRPAQVAADAPSRPGGLWEIDRAPCAQLLALPDDDRSYAAMFYYGYLAARAGIRVIDAAQIEQRIGNAMEECGAHPATPIPQAFRRALVPQRAALPARN